MTTEEFSRRFQQKMEDMKAFAGRDVPTIVGVEAANLLTMRSSRMTAQHGMT